MSARDGMRLSREERKKLNQVKLRLNTVEKMTFHSKSNPGKVYTARILTDGKLVCDCRGWTIRRGDQPRHCAHTVTLSDGLWKKQSDDGQYYYICEVRTDGQYHYIPRGDQ
jgi:hypothetical protein